MWKLVILTHGDRTALMKVLMISRPLFHVHTTLVRDAAPRLLFRSSLGPPPVIAVVVIWVALHGGWAGAVLSGGN